MTFHVPVLNYTTFLQYLEKLKQIIVTNDLSFDRVTWTYIQYFRWMALLPFKNKDFTYLPTSFLSVYITFCLAITASMHVQSVINSISRGKLDIEGIYEGIILTCVTIRYVLLITWRIEFKQLVDECNAIWSLCSPREQITLLQYDRKLKIFFHLFIISAFGICVTFTAASLIKWISAIKANNTESRKLPYKWFVEDVHETPNYEITFVIQVISSFITAFAVTGLEITSPLVIIFNSGYFRTLQDRLLILSTEDHGKNEEFIVYEKVLGCVKFHQRILKLCVNIDKLTRTLFFIQFLGTAYILSLVGLQLMGSDPDRYKFVPILILCFIQLLMCQYAPEFLLQDSEGVSMAAYFVYTPQMNLRTQKVLSIILERAQRPVEMTAGGIIKLSLETFGSLISSAISLFAVLRKLIH